MSKWKLVRLKFGRNVAHFGELGIGIEETSERIRSDTLFSAWLSAYARLFTRSEVEDLIEQFKTEPPFRLSSTFIYQQINNKVIDYLPCPLQFPPNYPVGRDLEFIKTYKKLKYLPLEIWQRWYQGNGFNDRNELVEKTITGKATGALTRAETFRYKEAFKSQRLPKIAVDRITRATNLYHTGVVQYRCEQNGNEVESLSGLYFLVEFPEPNLEVENTFLAVLDFLGGEGIGGERSSGAGQFKAEASDLTPEWKSTIEFSAGTHHSLISLFWQPSISPELLTQASYELQERGGWIASPASDGRQLRRNAVQMFTEGSVFPICPMGQLADVTPQGFRDHRIYRSGISLSLPIKIYGES
jgi:CRISPR-associated protein Csm4